MCETQSDHSNEGPRTTVLPRVLLFSANLSFIGYHNYTVYALFYKEKKKLYRAV